MTEDDYITKYGPTIGPAKYASKQVQLKKREETYKTHPYRRLTKEWFLWRYPDDGLERFTTHVNKSLQTEENMIARWGEELGKKKWQETLAKKNTVAIVREKLGDAAVTDIYARQQKTVGQQHPELKKAIKQKRDAGLEKYLTEQIRGKPRLDVFVTKYGEIDGTQRYHDAMKKAFHGPNRMSAPAKRIYDVLCQALPTVIMERLYCDVPGKREFWLSKSNKIYGYDFTDRETKSILEYNGSFWHPVEPDNSVHPVTKKTLTEMYHNDRHKIDLAKEKGFVVFVVTDEMSPTERSQVLVEFCNRLTKGK